MENRCPSCGAIWKDGQTVCPYCGTKARLPAAADAAPVPVENGAVPMNEAGRIRKPKTLEELQQFCARQQLPLDKMRFSIGYDTNTPRMFGICRTPEGEFLVYKNKADGRRSVRYQGPDEAFAVNEIYEKLKSETLKRRGPGPGEHYGAQPVYRSGGAGGPVHRSAGGARQRGRSRISPNTIGIIAVIILYLILHAGSCSNHKTVSRLSPYQGYYSYSGDEYYYYGDDWYLWDDVGGWVIAGAVDDLLYDNYADYYTSYDYSGGAYGDFSESDWYNGDYDDDYDSDYYYDNDYDSSYDDDSDWDWDWSSDSDWDSGWDSSDTDWDSDW